MSGALGTLPAGMRSRFVDTDRGLRIHVLEAGFEKPGRPAILLLHGFPELAWSWRRVMPALAAAGYWVIAPDQRGYGWTTGWTGDYDDDLRPFSQVNLARDMLALVEALGLSGLAAVIGHDFGSRVAGHCALLRPDLCGSVVMMSAPFPGVPAAGGVAAGGDINSALAALDPPRKHYGRYYSTPQADQDMCAAPQGLSAFLRAYYHMKSADWPHNHPHPLADAGAAQLARLPYYYVMPLEQTMPQVVAAHMPTPAQIDHCRWLTNDDLAIYVEAFAQTGFQGGLQWYRAARTALSAEDQALVGGRNIEIPAHFIAGASDWGVYQTFGALTAMQTQLCDDFRGLHLIQGAGHWVQQEKPLAVVDALLRFLSPAKQGH